MSQGSSVDIDGKCCQLHYFTGKVLASQKQKETQVYSQVSGTQAAPVTHVSSTTVNHHEFFLVDSAGKERSFKMTDFDFPCREGQTVSVMWAIPEGAPEGPYIGVRNHNTDHQQFIEPKRISHAFAQSKGMVWGIALGAMVVLGVVGNWFLGLLGLIGPFVYFSWRANKAAKQLMASSAVRDLDAQLAQVKAIAP